MVTEIESAALINIDIIQRADTDDIQQHNGHYPASTEDEFSFKWVR